MSSHRSSTVLTTHPNPFCVTCMLQELLYVRGCSVKCSINFICLQDSLLLGTKYWVGKSVCAIRVTFPQLYLENKLELYPSEFYDVLSEFLVI